MRNTPLLQYYGGKWSIGKKIIEHFPEHKTFVDVFGGSGAITLLKKPSKNEIINDIHNEIVNLYRVLRSDHETLIKMLKLTPYSRVEYYLCRETVNDSIEMARRTIVKSWLGIGDSLDNNTGFRNSITQTGPLTSPWCKLPDFLNMLQDLEA